MAQKWSWFSVTICTEMAETEVDFVSVGHCGLFRSVRVPFTYGEDGVRTDKSILDYTGNNVAVECCQKRA